METAGMADLITSRSRTPASAPFAGRIGGNQSFSVDKRDDANAELLAREPDAAPGMSLRAQFDLRPFRTLSLVSKAKASP
jgi:hypothetical protein